MEQLLNAFADTEYLVVMSDSNGEIRKNYQIPENYIVKTFVPQLKIMKYAFTIISNGGFNTVSEAIYSKIPLIIIPQGADNFTNGFRVQNLNLGKVLMREEITSEKIRLLANAMATGEGYDEKVLEMHSKQFGEALGMEQASNLIMEYMEGDA